MSIYTRYGAESNTNYNELWYVCLFQVLEDKSTGLQIFWERERDLKV